MPGADVANDPRARARQMAAAMVARGGDRQHAGAARQTGASQGAAGQRPTPAGREAQTPAHRPDQPAPDEPGRPAAQSAGISSQSPASRQAPDSRQASASQQVSAPAQASPHQRPPSQPSSRQPSPQQCSPASPEVPAQQPGHGHAREARYFDSSASRQASPAGGDDAPAVSPDALTDSPLDFDGDWPALAARLPVQGAVRQLFAQSELKSLQGTRFQVQVQVRHLAEPALVERARGLLCTHFGTDVQLQVSVGQVGKQTAAARASEQQARRQAASEQAIAADPFVRTLLEEFGATILPDSIKPLDGETTP